jgi:hypothetical protein
MRHALYCSRGCVCIHKIGCSQSGLAVCCNTDIKADRSLGYSTSINSLLCLVSAEEVDDVKCSKVEDVDLGTSVVGFRGVQTFTRILCISLGEIGGK